MTSGEELPGEVSEADRGVLEALRTPSAPVVDAVEDAPGEGRATDRSPFGPGPVADDGLGPQFREPPGDA